MAINRVEGVNQIRDRICDVIYRRNEKLLSSLLSLFNTYLTPRRISNIEDINALFDQLQRLNLGSINNLWAFRRIADFLQDADLQELVAQVGQLDIPEQHFYSIGRNVYAFRRANKNLPTQSSSSKNIEEESPGRSSSNALKSRTQPHLQDQIVQSRTFDLLSCQIGRRWRELGRWLGFHDADLDEFEERYSHNLKERIYSMLLEFAKNYHSNHNEMMSRICTALDNCKRVDLRKKVQQFTERQE